MLEPSQREVVIHAEWSPCRLLCTLPPSFPVDVRESREMGSLAGVAWLNRSPYSSSTFSMREWERRLLFYANFFFSSSSPYLESTRPPTKSHLKTKHLANAIARFPLWILGLPRGLPFFRPDIITQIGRCTAGCARIANQIQRVE